jgi:hypothetical protein
MKSAVRVFLSHTTRDHRDAELARRLGEGLSALGARVWIAPTSIPAGSQWEEKIVSGILAQSTHFLVIVSAASMTADWVLREIQLAEERRKHDTRFTLLPLVVGSVGDFSGHTDLFRLQQIPYREDFAAQLNEVAAALGLRPTVPTEFETLIREKTEGFVGRQYVFEAIDAFLANYQEGYLTIEGDPGVGKSAILAEYVKRTGCIAYFNDRSQGTNTPADFLRHVCAQLIARYGLDYPVLPPDAIRTGAFLLRLLNEASAQLSPGERLVIAVDALDEVDQRDEARSGTNLLFLPATLPQGVFFVVTRRQVSLPLVITAPQELVDIMKLSTESRDDIVVFIQRALAREGVRRTVASLGVPEEVFIHTLATRSENNFMYLRYVLADMDRGTYSQGSIEHIPVGLSGYYEDHWRRMGMLAKPLPRARLNIVYVLAEVRQPISTNLLSSLTQQDDVTVQEALDEWDQFLREETIDGQVRYSIYHASFRDFLHRKPIIRAAGLTIEGVNRAIATNLWKGVFGQPLNES